MTGDLPSPPRVVLPERLVDIGLAVGLALVVVAAEAFGNRGLPESLGEVVLGVTGALALLRRRRWPMGVLAVNAAVVAAEGVLGLRVVSAPTLLIALYTVCSRRSGDEGLRAAGSPGRPAGPDRQPDRFAVGTAVSAAVTVAAATAIGLYMGTRRQYVESLRERALQLARERALLADSGAGRGAGADRPRAARRRRPPRQRDGRPGRRAAARRSPPTTRAGRCARLDRADTGRQALAEMRRAARPAARDRRAASARPQPSVEQLDDLVAQMRARGPARSS